MRYLLLAKSQSHYLLDQPDNLLKNDLTSFLLIVSVVEGMGMSLLSHNGLFVNLSMIPADKLQIDNEL